MISPYIFIFILLVIGLVIISSDRNLISIFTSWFKRVSLSLGTLYFLFYLFLFITSEENNFTLENLFGLAIFVFLISMLLTFFSKWKNKFQIKKQDNEGSGFVTGVKRYIAEILIGGGVILEGYNFAFKPWRECSSSNGVLPSLKTHCTDIQSSELLFISIVMVVIGVILLSIRKK